MPRIEVMNIKFNLDGNKVDAEVYAALCDIPRGKRSGVVKGLLHAALYQDTSHPHPQTSSPSPIRKTHSERTGAGRPTAAAVETVQAKGTTQELDEFKSLIY
jgi:hypothetical protein